MSTIPGLKPGIPTTPTFLQSLQAARDAATNPKPSGSGITGLSTTLVKIDTIDAILKAVLGADSSDDLSLGAARPDALRRFELDDSVPAPQVAASPPSGQASARAERDAEPSAQAPIAQAPDAVIAREAGSNTSAIPDASALRLPVATGALVAGSNLSRPGLLDPARNPMASMNDDALRQQAAAMAAPAPSVRFSRVWERACPICGKPRDKRDCMCMPTERLLR